MVKDRAILTDTDRTRLGEMVKELQSVVNPCRDRIHELTDGIRRAEGVSASEIGRDVITMNSRFRAWDLDSGRSETFTLVYHGDPKVFEGRLSVLTSIGIRALGSRVGNVIDVPDRSGARRLRIESILYQPEAAGSIGLVGHEGAQV